MKNLTVFLMAAVCLLSPASSRAMDLKQSKFTEIINDVEVISAASQSASPAVLNGIFKVPDILRTGADSRAELVADDQTITRVGANTIFSFDPANRTIDLRQGSLLFHSPHGKGGGTIQTKSATASVLGTTIIVVTTPNGGFKILVLEGRATVNLPGITQYLSAGQMIFILPGGGISPIIVFLLDEQVKGSKLVGGFKNPLPSWNLINKAILGQLKLIKNGQAVVTGLLVGDSATGGTVQAIPVSIIQTFIQTENESSPPSGAEKALQEDFTINSSPLQTDNVFIKKPGFDITTDPNDFLGGTGLNNPFYGFPGYNIAINTLEEEGPLTIVNAVEGGLTIDLSAYAGQSAQTYPWFDIVALNNMDIGGSVTFTGLDPSDQLYLAAGNQLTIASGSTLVADCARFWIGGFQPITLDDVSLINNVGELDLDCGGALDLEGGTTLTADTITLTAGDSILLDNVTMLGGGALSMTAPNTITVGVTGEGHNPVDLTGLAAVNMAATTINLINVAFAATAVVDLACSTGNYNVGSIVTGDVNFINVTFGETLITSENVASFLVGAGQIGFHIHSL